MPIFEPMTLFGLLPTAPYVSVTPVMTNPRCQFLNTSYEHGKSQLDVSEILTCVVLEPRRRPRRAARPRRRGARDDLRVRLVREGGAGQMTWSAKGTYLDLSCRR